MLPDWRVGQVASHQCLTVANVTFVGTIFMGKNKYIYFCLFLLYPEYVMLKKKLFSANFRTKTTHFGHYALTSVSLSGLRATELKQGPRATSKRAEWASYTRNPCQMSGFAKTRESPCRQRRTCVPFPNGLAVLSMYSGGLGTSVLWVALSPSLGISWCPDVEPYGLLD